MIAAISTPRSAALARLAETEFDLLVIGGGIVGSGIVRDAAMRGLRVGLVDQHDFAFGSSSRSSRLLHGGLRYLERSRIGLVREASVEKKIIQRIAPHLAEPLAFVFPAYRNRGRPLWQLRLGVKLYDLLCRGRNFGSSCTLTPAETKGALPGLDLVEMDGAVRYFDALTNDARLVLDTLRSAAAHEAILANYVRYVDAAREGGSWRCAVKNHLNSEVFSVRARTIVNATGPWAQGIAHSAVKLRLSKGIHLVFDRSRLPVLTAGVIADGRRILFVLPWGERVIVGTTDTEYDARPEDVAVLPGDIRHVLHAVNSAFPASGLAKSDIVSCWAGLRPLLAGPAGAISDISRAHEIREPETGWWDVTGGKLTTYRLMAEQTVDRVAMHLGQAGGKCGTAEEPLLPPGSAVFSGIHPAPFCQAAVVHFIQAEWAITLEDVMIRRSGWHYYYRNSETKALQVANWMADLLGWTADKQKSELTHYLVRHQNHVKR